MCFSTIVKHFVRSLSSRLRVWFFACTAWTFGLSTLGITLQFICDVKIFYGSVPSLGVDELFTAYTPKDKLSMAVTVLFVLALSFHGYCELIRDADTLSFSGLRMP